MDVEQKKAERKQRAEIKSKMELVKKQQQLKAFIAKLFEQKAKTTITSYTSTISSYFDDMFKLRDKTLFEFAARHKLLMDALERRTTRPASKKAVLGVFMTFTKRLLESDAPLDDNLKTKLEYAYNFYHNSFLMFSKEVDKERGENKLTERMEENYLPWGQILSYRNHITHQYESKASPSASLSMCAILIEMMTEIPARGEYASVKLRNFDKSKDNYIDGLDDDKSALILVINQYKTSGLYGARKIEISPESKLWTYLKSFYQRFTKRDYLFGSGATEPRGSDALKRYITHPASEFFGDKVSLGSQSLRRAYISFLYSQQSMTLNEKQTIAKIAGHSLKMSQTYDRIKYSDGTPIEKEKDVEIPIFEVINEKAVAIRTGRGKYVVKFSSD